MKLPQVTGKDVIRQLKKFGFIAARQVGSHVRLEKYDGEKIIKLTVPVHPRPLKKGTLHRIIKDSGLTIEEFFA
jgi:predicted RNA binding protein YcfA (HicA-like mRNA interferase family)